MAKNEVLVHIDDRQMSDLKKSIKQSQLKNEAEINKLKKNLDQINKKLNDILIAFDVSRPKNLDEKVVEEE